MPSVCARRRNGFASGTTVKGALTYRPPCETWPLQRTVARLLSEGRFSRVLNTFRYVHMYHSGVCSRIIYIITILYNIVTAGSSQLRAISTLVHGRLAFIMAPAGRIVIVINTATRHWILVVINIICSVLRPRKPLIPIYLPDPW